MISTDKYYNVKLGDYVYIVNPFLALIKEEVKEITEKRTIKNSERGTHYRDLCCKNHYVEETELSGLMINTYSCPTYKISLGKIEYFETHKYLYLDYNSQRHWYLFITREEAISFIQKQAILLVNKAKEIE